MPVDPQNTATPRSENREAVHAFVWSSLPQASPGAERRSPKAKTPDRWDHRTGRLSEAEGR